MTKRRKKSKTSRFSGKKLLKTTFSALVIFIVCVLSLIGVCIEKGILFDTKDFPDISPPSAAADDNFDFAVYFLDVGQGDSELIVSGDTAVLIDAGEKEYGNTVVKEIKALGISKLDYVIATHPHSDHIGGLPSVIESFEIGKIIAPRIPDSSVPTSAAYENFLDAVKGKDKKLTAAKAGTSYALDGAELIILAPLGNDYEELNNYSIVCKIIKGNTSFLFTGDAEKEEENDLIENGIDLSADVLKAGHHGSKSSSTESFLSAAAPSVSVISCGKDNKYGHPSDAALSRLKKYSANIYRTDLGGTITVFSDGEKLYVRTEKDQSVG